MIEQQQAAARGAVMAGAERQRRLDLDAELVRGGMLKRSCRPCTMKRPARTGTSSSSVALTQSLASTISKAMPCASSSPAARPTSSRIEGSSGGSAKCRDTSQRPSGPLERRDSQPGPRKSSRSANRPRALRFTHCDGKGRAVGVRVSGWWSSGAEGGRGRGNEVTVGSAIHSDIHQNIPGLFTVSRPHLHRLFNNVIASLAKQSMRQKKNKNGLLRRFASRNDDGTQPHILAARIAPEFCLNIRLLKTEGAGKTGCPFHPQPRM